MRLIAHFNPLGFDGHSQVWTSKRAGSILVVWNLADTTGEHHKAWKLNEHNLIEALVFARDVVKSSERFGSEEA